MALSSTALTSLENAETFIGLTVDVQDAILEILINGVSKRIEDYAKRNFKSQTYSEIHDRPCHTNELVLNQPDMTALGFLATEWDDAMTVKYTGAGTHARVQVTDTSLIIMSRAGATETTTTTTFAAQATIANMVTTVDAVSGWDASTLDDGPSAYLIQRGAVNAKDKLVTLQAWFDYDGEYETDYKAGIVRFTGWGAVAPKVRVDYTAGFSTIPAGVELTALEMVRDAWFARSRDSTLQSESLGDYSYSNAIPNVTSNPVWVERLAEFVRVLP